MTRTPPLRGFADSVPPEGGPTAAWLYPGTVVTQPELVKQLLLYFPAGVATMAGVDDRQSLLDECPWLAEPLADEGLLHFLDYHAVYGADDLYELPEGLGDDTPDSLVPRDSALFAILESARQGYSDVLADFTRRGGPADEWRRASAGADITATMEVAGRYLEHGIQLAPLTDQPDLARLFMRYGAEVLVPQAGPTVDRGHLRSTVSTVVLDDLASVAVDLTSVPLPDILDFRREYGRHYAEYSSEVRRFALELLSYPEDERARSLHDRRESLRDLHDDLGRHARRSFKVGFGRLLSLAAGAAGIAEGSVVSGALSFASAAVTEDRRPSVPSWATYLAMAKDRFPS